MARRQSTYVGRGGDKLAAALDAFELDPRGLLCADLGANVGGFADCLLRRGAARVYAVDTGYGALAWSLRTDDRVVVMERINALHCDPPEPVDLVTVDVAWTPQERIVPAALRWLRAGGRLISLLKPHYELVKMRRRRPGKPLSDRDADDACGTVCRRLGDLGASVRAAMRSPLRGKGGSAEFLLLIAPGR
ncbi:MAG: SAM-dependent methyltransferase [Planctomycetota bacterium]